MWFMKMVAAAFVCLFVTLGDGRAQQQGDPEAKDLAGNTEAAPIVVLMPSEAVAVLKLRILPLNEAQLGEAAVAWQQALQTKVREISELNIALITPDTKDAEQLRKRILTLSDQRAALIERYRTVLDAWEQKGGALEEVKKHRTFIQALSAEELRISDPITVLKRGIDWMFSWDGGLNLLLDGLVLAVTFIALFTVARIAQGVVTTWLGRVPNISQLLKTFVTGIVYWLTFVVGLMFALAFVGVNITPLFAVFGGLSFILGFALQETLGNLAAGLMIMVLKPFDVGDFVETAGISGEIEKMSVVSTTIKTPDNQVIMVPNSKIWGDIITNVNASDTRRVDLVFGIGYSDDIEHAKAILADAVALNPLTLREPEPTIVVGALADSSVNIFCRPWVRTQDYWTVYWDLMADVKVRFDDAGISIPFPQRDVHVYPAWRSEVSRS